MKAIIRNLIYLGLVILPGILFAQNSNRSASPLDTIVTLAAAEQELTQVPNAELPSTGTFWLVTSNGTRLPMPTPPLDSSVPVYELADGIFLVDGTKGQVAVPNGQTTAQAATAQAASVLDFITAEQEAAWERMLVKLLGLEQSQDTNGFTSITTVADTNGLWLELTDVSNGKADLNLHNATNWVYAIWSTTDLLMPWSVETEVWPWDTNSEAFTIPTLGRQNLFLRAEDWTEVDSRGAGVPDWWQWYWFGELTGTALDLDDLGNTFWFDFAFGLSPNVIQFSVTATNSYWHQMNVPITAELIYGQPSYYAVLVDDTNFTHAVWHNYTTPNLTANLGLEEGWHDVWVGLRGHADRANQATWQWKRLKLDYTAPQLIVTNPVVTTLTVPLLQVQGYSPEALQRLTYDLDNAAGSVTNQLVEISGQTYDRSHWEFSTNFFHAYDVLLTTGVNTLTFHATDRAGNTTTWTTNLTLNNSSRTNPPVVQMLWPTDGLEIVGNNIVCRGWVEDASSEVTVQLVNANGETNNVGSLVGRDGIFYAETVTLATGINHLAISVTDSAGNILTTNLTVMTSDLGLTLNTVVAGQSLVTGTIDREGYSIYVNGVTATNNGDGSWSAEITPIGINGGAVVVNAVLGGDPSLQQLVEAPQGTFVSQFRHHLHKEFDGGGTLDENMNWLDGDRSTTDSYRFRPSSIYPNSTVQIDQVWPTNTWPEEIKPGLKTIVADWFTDPHNIITNISDDARFIYTPVHREFQGRAVEPDSQQKLWRNNFTDTEIKLATGGPLGSTEMNLWCLSASVRTYTNVPPEQIQIGTLGKLDTNGVLYVMLPDNDPEVVTPIFLGAAIYTFPKTSAVKVSKTVYISVDPTGAPAPGIPPSFKTKDIAKNLEAQLTQKLDIPKGAVRIQAHVQAKMNSPLGWNPTQSFYFCRLNWDAPLEAGALSLGGNDHVTIDPIACRNEFQGSDPSLQFWVNDLAHEVIWLCAYGGVDHNFTPPAGEISSGYKPSHYNEFTINPDNKKALRKLFGFE